MSATYPSRCSRLLAHPAIMRVAGDNSPLRPDTHRRLLSNNGVARIEFITIQLSTAKGEDEPGVREGTAEVPHQSAAAYRPGAAAVFDAAPALDTALDLLDPQPARVELLVRHGLLSRALLPQIKINSMAFFVVSAMVIGQRPLYC